MRNIYKILTGKPEQITPFGKTGIDKRIIITILNEIG
jgi:hypothetical protein